MFMAGKYDDGEDCLQCIPLTGEVHPKRLQTYQFLLDCAQFPGNFQRQVRNNAPRPPQTILPRPVSSTYLVSSVSSAASCSVSSFTQQSFIARCESITCGYNQLPMHCAKGKENNYNKIIEYSIAPHRRQSCASAQPCCLDSPQACHYTPVYHYQPD